MIWQDLGFKYNRKAGRCFAVVKKNLCTKRTLHNHTTKKKVVKKLYINGRESNMKTQFQTLKNT